jgi:Phage Tail Collar Domain
VSEVYTFIATKTTYAATIPLGIRTVEDLNRRVRKTLSGSSYPLLVGELRDFPLPVAVPNFLLCDGSELAQLDFPELYAYLGDSQGTPVTSGNFLLPNYVGSKDQSPDAPPQTVDPGSVGIGQDPSEPTDPGQGGGTTGGNPPSGGRPRNPDDDDDDRGPGIDPA